MRGSMSAAGSIRLASPPLCSIIVMLAAAIIIRPRSKTRSGSVRNLLGEKPDPMLVESLSNEKQVTATTPPTFLVASTADTVVPAENSVQFYLALRHAKVPAELHIYERGNHGFGMAQNDPIVGTWTKLCAEWLKLHGFVK